MWLRLYAISQPLNTGGLLLKPSCCCAYMQVIFQAFVIFTSSGTQSRVPTFFVVLGITTCGNTRYAKYDVIESGEQETHWIGSS